MSKNRIRMATKEDAKELLEIYAPYVTSTAITFEYTVPTIQEFEKRIENVLKKYPYIVAYNGTEILGYAYASAFHERPACNWAVETSIYVKKERKKLGIGKLLYDALENILWEQNIINVNACIAYPEVEDEYLTKNSVEFHQHLGYHLVGTFSKCGYKFGNWYHLVWMEKHIGKHQSNPLEVKKIDEVRPIIAQKYGIFSL